MPEPIDIILLAYNRVDYLRRMVDALEANTVWPYRLTVVDNVSGPETRQWLRDNERRFHQIVWNRRNEHLAGHQRGIEATHGELFVVSDPDLLPHAPTADGCWLTRLVGLAERHRDFGLIACRIDTDSIRTSPFEGAPIVDGDIIETRTGVWLNLMRRHALRVPYMSDGITCYAVERAGYRVGVARSIFCTHLGDEDAAQHPDYLARKQSATGFGIVYPDYPEVEEIGRPPTLEEVALATPVLAALEHYRVALSDAVELSSRAWPPVASVASEVESAVASGEPTAGTWQYEGASPLALGGARAVVLALTEHQPVLLDQAQARAGEWVVVLTPEPVPGVREGWRIVDERPGVHPVLHRMARAANRLRWRRMLGYSTTEFRERWLAVMRAGCFGDDTLRLYVLQREKAVRAAHHRWQDPRTAEPLGAAGADGVSPGEPPSWHPPLPRPNRLAGLATKASRLARAEWHLHQRKYRGPSTRRPTAAQEHRVPPHW